jgi:hypothetical protein
VDVGSLQDKFTLYKYPVGVKHEFPDLIRRFLVYNRSSPPAGSLSKSSSPQRYLFCTLDRGEVIALAFYRPH